jgi:hypothetical protein
MTRPTKRTPALEQRLLGALRAGSTRRAAAPFAGVSEDSLERWERSSAGFADAIKKAEADAEVRHVANIAKAAQDGTWQASAWWLEPRRPDDYGRRERIELNIRQTAERLGAELGLDPDELVREAERLVRGGA